ncbi:MAG: hypothetical protein E1N59_2760 [Puniceicoccaceae bacterium 5H]|nr:MAG: hypothetical protein E1N59_2760 [Puniceicoccaceae bacterium 5H]
MNWVLILLLAGLLFAMELLLPGGVLGIIAAVLVVVAAIMAIAAEGVWAGLLVLAGGLAAGIAMFTLELKVLSHSQVARWFRHSSVSKGSARPATSAPAELIGQRGVVASDLAPTGSVSIEGRLYTARSQGDFLHRGTEVEVVAQNVFNLVVRPVRQRVN